MLGLSAMIDQSTVKEWFTYKDGKLFWAKSPKYDILIGSEAGYTRSDGYIVVGFKGRTYLLHRVIFLMFNGYLPELVDHRDQDHTNNRKENLREATKRENVYNTRKLWGHNTSGVRGVSWDSKKQKWAVRFKHEGKYKFFGYFENKEEAIMVREQTERRFLQ